MFLRCESLDLRGLAARSATETATTSTEVSTEVSTATSTSATTEVTSRTTTAAAPIPSSSFTLMSSTASSAPSVVDLVEAITTCCSTSSGRLRLRGIICPALSASNRRSYVWGLCLGRIPRNDLEGLAQGIVTATRLLIPLCLRCCVGRTWLDARCCGSIRSLDVRASIDRSDTGVDLGEAGVGDSRVGYSFLGLGSGWLCLCNFINPGFFCGEGCLVKCGLLDLSI